MIHNYLRDDSGDHWAVGVSQYSTVLLQVQESSEQVRIQMSPEQAEACAHALLAAVDRIKNKT